MPDLPIAMQCVPHSCEQPAKPGFPTPGILVVVVAAFAVCMLGAPNAGHAATPESQTYCGGFGQRACCFWEADDSCDGSLAETGAIGGTCSGFEVPAGLCGYSSPGSLSFCGGDGQRACCWGETGLFNSCDSGSVELIGKAGGTCASPALAPGANAGTCWTPTACGGEGERACTVTEQFPSCDSGLIEIGGCNDSSCGTSSGWCYRPTACGGDGQRACCTLLDIGGSTTTCNDGLEVVPGASGDATCGIGNLVGNTTASTQTCASLSTLTTPIAEPGTGWLSSGAGDHRCDSRGYADLHVHMFANLGHGGGAMSGVPYSEDGVNDALRQDFGTYLDLVKKDGAELPQVKTLALQPCDPDLYPDCEEDGFVLFHGDHLFDHLLGSGTFEGRPSCLAHLTLGCGAPSNLGSPLFTGWPTWRTTTHQQMYHTWVERAWRGGLRLMAQLAVTNEALCRSSKVLRGTDCNDEMGPVDAQIDATLEFEGIVDGLAGGPGLGWFRVVTTPDEARQVIRDGKLAVVIGIEVANLFNCKKDGCSGKDVGETDEQYIVRKVDEYYDKGVRIVFPIHNFENAFGAPATWQDVIHAGNYVSEGTWWAAEDCSAKNYGFKLVGLSTFIVEFFGFGNLEFPPDQEFVACNQRGLTPLGEHMIRYMMQKGIVVDVDHMSNHALDATLDIAEELDRPVIASHVQFFDLNEQSIRHERMRTRSQLERIRDSGGMIAAMLKDDKQDSDDVIGKHNVAYTNSPSGKVIADDCRYSSKTWAQGYQYASDIMQGPVAMGSDWNGVAGHVGPRFGNDACGQDAVERSAQGRADNKLEYPFTLPGFGTLNKQVTGAKTFDFNVDGLAHIGLLPDLVADLSRIGLSATDLDPLMRSASGFADVWDRAEGRIPATGLPPGCSDGPVCTPGSCDDGIDCTEDWCDAGPEQCRSTTYGGLCRADVPCSSSPDDCDDGVACTADVCDGLGVNDPANRGCSYYPSGCTSCSVAADCDDADLCTAELCIDGFCEHRPNFCDDGEICTVNACDPLTGRCEFAAAVPGCCLADEDCDDGKQCTGSETCGAGHLCEPGVPVDCHDDDYCTLEACVEGVTTPNCDSQPITGCVPLDVWRVRSRRNPGRDTRSVRVHGGLPAGNVFTGTAPITVNLIDGAGAAVSFTFTECTGSPTRIRCADAERAFRLRTSPLRGTLDGIHFRAALRYRDLGDWPVAPVVVTLEYDGLLSVGAVVRCDNASIGVACR